MQHCSRQPASGAASADVSHPFPTPQPPTVAAKPSGTEVNFTEIADALGPQNCTFTVEVVALGQTGPGGTVLTGQDLASANVNPAPEDTTSTTETGSSSTETPTGTAESESSETSTSAAEETSETTSSA